MPIFRKRIFYFCFITIFLHVGFVGLVFVELPGSDLLGKSAGRAYAYDLQAVGKLIDDLKRWSAKSSAEILDDDLTLVVVDAERAAE